MSNSGAYKVGGRFPLGESIERRAIGDIYAATDDTTGQAVHVVLVSPHIFPQPGMKEQALAEIQKIAQIVHPHIDQIIDVGQIEDGRIYQVTPASDGQTLATTIGTTGPFTLPQVVEIFARIVDALEEAKRVGVFHRDLSPANLWLMSEGIQVMHFGLAEPAGGPAFGDPWFMSPEQAQGRPVDERSCIYALGSLVFYAVCGSPVFADADPALVTQKHQSEPPQAPSARRPDLGLPPEFDQLVSRALIKDPGGRFASLQEFEAALQALPGAPAVIRPMEAPPVARSDAISMAPTMMSSPGDIPAPTPAAAPVAVAPVAAPPAGPAPAAAPAPAKPQPPGAGPAPRRAKKKGFRETLWFMKGDLEAQIAEAVDEKELAEVEAGDGKISDKDKGLDDKYKDDGSVTAEDRRKYSVKTGQTGMMPSVKAPGAMDASKVKDTSRTVSILVWVVIALVVLGGGGGAVAYLMLKPKASFLKSNLHTVFLTQISDYQEKVERTLMKPPDARPLPSGEDKELLAKFLESAPKSDGFMPDAKPGAVDYLAALESRIKEIAKENEKMPKRKRQDLFRRLHRRRNKANAVRLEYAKLKDGVIQKVVELVGGALKSKKNDELRMAKEACLTVLAHYDLGDKKAEIASSCAKVSKFFK